MAFALSRLRGLRGLTQFPVGSRGGGPGGIRKRTRQGSRGFTLIELLIVVAIIGILAAIAIPNLMSARKKTNYARSASDAKTAVNQASVYFLDNDVYPGTLDQLRLTAYANVATNDVWGTPFQTSDRFRDDTIPVTSGSDVHVCSYGPQGSEQNGTCHDTPDFVATPTPGADEGVGYSATYGAWSGS